MNQIIPQDSNIKNPKSLDIGRVIRRILRWSKLYFCPEIIPGPSVEVKYIDIYGL